MADLSYWKDIVQTAAGECGLELDSQQLEWMAESVQAAHECYDLVMHVPSIPFAISCPECGGRGRGCYVCSGTVQVMAQ